MVLENVLVSFFYKWLTKATVLARSFIFILPNYLIILLKYSWYTVLCYFQVYSHVNQLCAGCLVAQLCPAFCHRVDCIAHQAPLSMWILQARILEWVAMTSSRGSSKCRDLPNPGFPHCRQILYHLSHQGSQRILEWVAYPFSRGPSQTRNWTRVSCLQADSLPAELLMKPESVTHTDSLWWTMLELWSLKKRI